MRYGAVPESIAAILIAVVEWTMAATPILMLLNEKLVQPGKKRPEGPSPEATGFKLNVCYRAWPGSVRCAIEDFKD